MFERCRIRVSPILPDVRFALCLDRVSEGDTRFDVLITNSFPYYFPASLGLLQWLASLLSDNAMWLAGRNLLYAYNRAQNVAIPAVGCCRNIDVAAILIRSVSTHGKCNQKDL